jgi:hypothetical protein
MNMQVAKNTVVTLDYSVTDVRRANWLMPVRNRSSICMAATTTFFR